ncbi:MAG: hypothetical protein AB1435_06030 [Chloroflexota bacterium]
MDAVPQELGAAVSCEEIIAEICRELSAAGFHVAQSFDLRSARALFPDYACPHHGTALCDCQYSVLLIYGQATAPETLIVHGHDVWCRILLADNPHREATSHLASEIAQVLAATGLILPADCEQD